MNSYINVTYNIKSKSFRAILTYKYGGVERVIRNAVIDTGCTTSHFSANILLSTNNQQILKRAKYNDLKTNKNAWSLGVGVDTHGKNIPYPKTLQDALNNPCVRIKKCFKDIYIDGHYIGNKDVYISYDTTDVMLIGMDFIKEWDMHIGKSKEGLALLACNRWHINKEYLRKLNETFELGDKILTAECIEDIDLPETGDDTIVDFLNI